MHGRSPRETTLRIQASRSPSAHGWSAWLVSVRQSRRNVCQVPTHSDAGGAPQTTSS